MGAIVVAGPCEAGCPAGDLDAAPGRDPPLHRGGGFGQRCGPGKADALEAVALAHCCWLVSPAGRVRAQW